MMDPRTWRRVRSLFDELAEVPRPERAGWLERCCGDEPDVRAELERLLAADEASSGWLRPGEALEDVLREPPSALAPGAQVGPYRLRELIATGGMGAVWCAEQTSPRRLVALKTLRADLAGPGALKRFRAEAELLGHLRHPGIAQVFDAGACTLDGREVPYLAMEYIEGSRGLVEACNERGLDRRARLRLFAEACDAVHHGHQRGVIHRDLKPGNVLVDAEGHPKVIDFGLARALDPEGLGLSLAHTRAGEILGTLAYMSPEHVSGDPREVDVRSDVYSLGCILCELVTGAPPLDPAGMALAEVGRRIAEDPPRLPPSLPADLRWVIERALEKEPGRRYPSASELAADVRRLLAFEPVLAGRPSSLYRLRRLARRHRVALGAAVAVVGALLVGLLEARSEARAAERAQAEARAAGVRSDQARVVAERQADLARSAWLFVADLFHRSDVFEQGRGALVVDAIRDAEQILGTIADPTERAILTGVVGKAWLFLDDNGRAAPLIREAAASLRASLPPEDPFRLEVEVVEADLLEQEQRFEESLALSEQLLPRLERAMGPDHRLTRYLRLNAAICCTRLEDHARAERLLRQALEWEMKDRKAAARALELAVVRFHLGGVLVELGRADEGLEMLEGALRMVRHEGRPSPHFEATIRLAVGRTWHHLGEHELALEDLLEVERLYAGRADHSNRFALALDLASCLHALGRLEEAEERAREAEEVLAVGWREPGLRHVMLARLQGVLALARGELGRAEELARAALALAEEVLPAGSIQQAFAHVNLARVLLAAGRPAEAAIEAGRGSEALREGANAKALASALEVWTRALLAAGDADAALLRAGELVAGTPQESPLHAERQALLARARDLAAAAAR